MTPTARWRTKLVGWSPRPAVLIANSICHVSIWIHAYVLGGARWVNRGLYLVLLTANEQMINGAVWSYLNYAAGPRNSNYTINVLLATVIVQMIYGAVWSYLIHTAGPRNSIYEMNYNIKSKHYTLTPPLYTLSHNTARHFWIRHIDVATNISFFC